ncbi:tetratricopeptide repeat protein [Candidatus Babeliales bacterium]|nr:tetratricopeptide repeat protein [Candidatus Babeliales bacterium]
MKEIQQAMKEWQKERSYKEKLQQKLKQNPNNIKILIELGFMYMEDMDDTEKALRLLNRALILNPENVDAFFWIAMTYFHYFPNDLEKAKKLLEKALKIDNTRADCHHLIYNVINNLGENREKHTFHLKKAIEMEPTWIRPRITFVYLLISANKLKEAQIVAQETLNVFNNLKTSTQITPIKKYYEKYITGRTSSIKPKIETLFKRIKKARLKL